MKQLRGIDLKRARLVPSSVFASPEEVVDATGLSLAQKLAILRRWEFDARKADGFARGSAARVGGATLLRQVQRALDALAGTPSKIPAAFGDLMPLEKPRPLHSAQKDDAVESPCAAPGVVLHTGGRTFSRM